MLTNADQGKWIYTLVKTSFMVSILELGHVWKKGLTFKEECLRENDQSEIDLNPDIIMYTLELGHVWKNVTFKEEFLRENDQHEIDLNPDSIMPNAILTR
jgi:hypothetical protein